MPEIRRYTVTQTRQVRVDANSEVDAIRIADAAFTNGQNVDNSVKDGPVGIWGNTVSRVRVVAVEAHEGL